MAAGLVHPFDETTGSLDHPAVAAARVANDDLGFPPIPSIDCADACGGSPLKIAIPNRSHPHRERGSFGNDTNAVIVTSKLNRGWHTQPEPNWVIKIQ